MDYAFIACSAIDRDGRVMDFDLSRIAVKKAAMSSATQKFLLTTPAKFGRTALSAFADLTDFDAVIDGRSKADVDPGKNRPGGG